MDSSLESLKLDILTWPDLYNFSHTGIVIGKLKLILTTKKPSLLHLANHTSCHQFITIVSRPVILEPRVFSHYLQKTTFATLIGG